MKRRIFAVSITILLILPSTGLTGQEKGRILFDEYFSSIDLTKFQGFVSALENEGYTVRSTRERIDSSILKRENYDVFIMSGPNRSFSDEEEKVVKDFVRDGGGLIILGEGGPRMRRVNIYNPINNISRIFGIQFNDDYVVDPQRKIEGFSLEEQLVISNFKSHPVTKDVKSIGYLYGCSLTLESSATALAFGASTTTADGKKGKDIVVLAAAEYGKGRVVAMGDYDFLLVVPQGNFLSILDNRNLGLNMIAWVSQPSSGTVSSDTTEADRSASEGYALFSQREYSQAKSEFEKALKSYTELNNEKASEMMAMIDSCEKGLDAEAALERGVEYYNQGKYSTALTEFEKSKSLYGEIGDSEGSLEAQSMIDACDKALTAEAGHEMGEKYYSEGNYENALTEFEKSKSLYTELGDSENSLKAQSMIDACDKALTAENDYEKGLEYHMRGEYDQAIAKYEEALTSYRELGNDAKVRDLENRKMEAQAALKRIAQMKKILGGSIILAVSVVVLIIFLKRSKTVKRTD
jgi:tetratricopeptide (TPR) repeat protein